MVDEKVDEWVTPEEVAQVMLALVQQNEVSEVIGDTKRVQGKVIPVQGGTILEVSKSVREVNAFNDPGPVGRAGNTVAHAKVVEDEVFNLLSQRGWGTSKL